MDICLAGARAEASRRNGARSRGPKTPEGKARSAQNALKHGLRAQRFLVVGNERPREFDALEAALVDELAPEGTLQGLLAGRIARAAWRLERAERIEADLFAHEMMGDRNLALALIRDGNGARAFDTLLRYRGSALAELWRALRLLKALQAEPAPEQPIEPEARENPGETAPVSAVAEVDAAPMERAEAPAARTPAAAGPARHAPVPPHPAHDGVACGAAVREKPIEPEARGNPGDAAHLPVAGETSELPRCLASERRPCDRQGSEDSGGTSWRPNWRSAAKPRARS